MNLAISYQQVRINGRRSPLTLLRRDSRMGVRVDMIRDEKADESVCARECHTTFGPLISVAGYELAQQAAKHRPKSQIDFLTTHRPCIYQAKKMPTVASPEAAALQINLLNDRSVNASIALVFWEYLITMRYEWDFLSAHRWTAVTWVFLINRYLMLATAIVKGPIYNSQTPSLCFPLSSRPWSRAAVGSCPGGDEWVRLQSGIPRLHRHASHWLDLRVRDVRKHHSDHKFSTKTFSTVKRAKSIGIDPVDEDVTVPVILADVMSPLLVSRFLINLRQDDDTQEPESETKGASQTTTVDFRRYTAHSMIGNMGGSLDDGIQDTSDEYLEDTEAIADELGTDEAVQEIPRDNAEP
ncbi:hypothetical protein NM688_g5762 [Phlebia brevispora]|uniref:Uncharacterized protein n=1 Tax=Phlebia brevispora TaxID=194682 RepID=A0ACC1SQA4_9APHY|nr:hypothetical protein NM688_g5762 [Phlebia brevispora]